MLALRDIDPPTCGDRDVIVRVHAAGCGPDVWHVMTGLPYFARLGLGLRRPKLRVRGLDVAGVVETVGSAVEGVSLGDEVFGVADGSFAELAVARAAKVAPKPTSLDFTEAAALPISGLTALQALRDVAAVQAGQRVLVIGAGGGVGTCAVQIAKSMGAHVTAVCSTGKRDLVRSIGADDVIDYTREDFTDGQTRWDVIVDTAGRRALRALRRALTAKGTLVVVGGDGGGRWTGGFFRGMLGGPLLSPFVGQKLRSLISKEKREDLIALAELVERGELAPVIDRTFPLRAAADAIRYLAQGHPAGKVVVTVV
ncbi:MAG: NAD(P)-dependent alcohol dehydrogenase [Acidimicrobiia bacterium]